MGEELQVRPAEPDDELAVRRVLDGAMLDFSLDDADVGLVAESENVIGALLASTHERGGGAHVDAVAVRRSRRGQGVGSRLVEHLAGMHSPLTADCRPEVRAFYEAMGFRTVQRGGRAFAVSP